MKRWGIIAWFVAAVVLGRYTHDQTTAGLVIRAMAGILMLGGVLSYFEGLKNEIIAALKGGAEIK